jgi:hypothetical protein
MSDTQETLYFRINAEAPLVQAVGQNLPKGWSLGRISTRRERLVFYDTFEEEALRKGLAVIRKKGVLSTLDHLAANWMLPAGGFLIALFVGWKLGKQTCMEELGLRQPNPAFLAWLWIVRVVAPAAVLILLISVILGKDFS